MVDLSDESTKKWIRSLSDKQFIFLIFTLGCIVIGIITFVTDQIFIQKKFLRPDNLHAIIIEVGIGVLITIIVYTITHHQQIRLKETVDKIKSQQEQISEQTRKIDEQTKEIEKLTKNISIAFKERQLRLVSAIQSQAHFIIDKCKHINNLIVLWENEKNHIKKQNRTNTLIYNLNSMSNYVNQNTLSEINAVGNRKLGVAYFKLITECNFDSSFFDLENDFAGEFRNHFLEILNKLGGVLDELSQFINENDLRL